jgi:hypothetical protein
MGVKIQRCVSEKETSIIPKGHSWFQKFSIHLDKFLKNHACRVLLHKCTCNISIFNADVYNLEECKRNSASSVPSVVKVPFFSCVEATYNYILFLSTAPPFSLFGVIGLVKKKITNNLGKISSFIIRNEYNIQIKFMKILIRYLS